MRQSAVTKSYEQLDKDKRKRLLETLSGILEKKRKCVDTNESETTDQFLAADGNDSLSSSAMRETQAASSATILTPSSSAPYNRNPKSRENKMKSVPEESNSSLRESYLESGRNSGLSSRNSKQSKQPPDLEGNNYKPSQPVKKPPLLGRCPAAPRNSSLLHNSKPSRESYLEFGRNSTLSSRNSKQSKQPSDLESDNYKPSQSDKKPPLLGHSPSSSKHCVQLLREHKQGARPPLVGGCPAAPRNSNLPHNSKQSKQPSVLESDNYKPSQSDKKPPLLGRSPSTSNQHRMSQSSKRNSSANDESLLGPYSENENDRVVRGAVVDHAPVQHTRKVVVLSNSEIEKSTGKRNDDFSSTSNSVQEAECNSAPWSIQERGSEAGLLQTEVNKPSLIVTADQEHTDDDDDELFAFSPPRQVRLKFRDGGSKISADTTEQKTPATNDVILSPINPCRNITSTSEQSKQLPDLEGDNCKPSEADKKLIKLILGSCPDSPGNSSAASRNSKQSKQSSDLGGDNSKPSEPVKKSPLLGHSPAAPRNSSTPSRNSTQSKQSSDLKGDNCKLSKSDTKSPLLGRCPSTSKHCLPLLRERSRNSKRKFSADGKSPFRPYLSSANVNEGGVSKCNKKPLLQLDESGEYMKRDGNNYRLCRDRFTGQRTYPHPAANSFTDERSNHVAERSEWSKNGNGTFQVQRTPRFEREIECQNELLWRQTDEEASWQERDGESWLEEDKWQEREYDDRCEEPSWRGPRERITDLRQKLNSNRRYKQPQHVDEDYSFNRQGCRSPLIDEQPIMRVDDGRRCLLRSPSPRLRYQVDEDKSRMVDDLSYDTQRRQYDSLLGDYPERRHDNLSLQEDDDSWMNVDRRRWKQSWEYSALFIKEEPRHDWSREVR